MYQSKCCNKNKCFLFVFLLLTTVSVHSGYGREGGGQIKDCYGLAYTYHGDMNVSMSIGCNMLGMGEKRLGCVPLGFCLSFFKQVKLAVIFPKTFSSMHCTSIYLLGM